MSREANQAAVETALKLINSGDVTTGLTTLFAEDVVDHDPAADQPPGRAGFMGFFGTLVTAFPDLRMEPRHIAADDEHVTIAYTLSGTHLGDFMGAPPSGRAFKADGIEIYRFADGQVVERWGITDDKTLLSQLGFISLPF